MGRVNINGMSYEGENISVINNVVYVDGKKVDGPETSTALQIEITGGNLNQLIVRKGDVKANVNSIGSIKAGGSVDVKGSIVGDVEAGGSVRAQDIGGDIDAGGSVHCGQVRGNISAGGSVRHGS